MPRLEGKRREVQAEALLVGQQLIEFLGDPESVAECDDMGACVDSLVPWMQSSNFKVPKAEQGFSA